jgi:transposase-like protein
LSPVAFPDEARRDVTEKYFGHAPRELRAAAVARYLTTDLTLEEVGEQFGTHKSNICNWVKAAAGSQALKKKNKPTTAATTPDGRSAQEKLRLLLESSRLSEAERGEFLRREGLRDDDLQRFEAEALGGLSGEMNSAADQRRIRELERVNAKQEKRLREAEVIIDLQKKAHELWGVRDDDTTKE